MYSISTIEQYLSNSNIPSWGLSYSSTVLPTIFELISPYTSGAPTAILAILRCCVLCFFHFHYPRVFAELGIFIALKVILGDTDRLRGIILNLYSNAAKFTRKGLIEVSVDVLDRNTAPEPGPGYDKITLPPYKSSLTSFSTQNAQVEPTS